jgi:hypothetical protein
LSSEAALRQPKYDINSRKSEHRAYAFFYGITSGTARLRAGQNADARKDEKNRNWKRRQQ